MRNLGFSRRELLIGLAALGATPIKGVAGAAQSVRPQSNESVEYGQDTLPAGIRSRRVDNNNGITMHILEAGFEVPGRRFVVLLHGFPELAYTWRHQLLPLAAAGFSVIGPG